MTQNDGWVRARTTIIGCELALIGGLLATVFGFALAVSSQSQYADRVPSSANTVLNIASVLAILAFAAGFLLLRVRVGSKASIGFVGFAIAGIALAAASSEVDGLSSSSTLWAALDIGLVFGGSFAALIGGMLLVTSLPSLTKPSGAGKASAYVLLVGGIVQMLAGVVDSAGVVTGSEYLQNSVGTPIFGVAGILFAVIAPALLYASLRRLRKKTNPVSQVANSSLHM